MLKGAFTSAKRIGQTCKISIYVKKTGNLDFNKIGSEGCSHLSKASWPHLKMIELGTENIEYRDGN